MEDKSGNKDCGGSMRNASKSEAVEHTTEGKVSCAGDGCEWQGKGPHLCPSPVIYRSRGATPLKTRAQRQLKRVAPYVVDEQPRPRRNNHVHTRTLSLRRGNRRGAAPRPVHPHVTHYTCDTPPEKVRPLHTTCGHDRNH
jgi:hypothetical protein